MEKTNVLVVEDETSIRDLIALHLNREGYKVFKTGSGEEALQLLKNQKFDLLVLDWMLPGVSGLEIARSVRRDGDHQETPVLMVTARTQTADIVAGLESGADDYVGKPFDVGVLMARVRALLRRAERSKTGSAGNLEVLQIGEMEINLAAHEVRCGTEMIQLTPSEFKLLVALSENKGRVLTREALIGCVQGEGVNVVGRSVDTHVFGLRKKLGPCGDFVETIRGIGYRVRAEI